MRISESTGDQQGTINSQRSDGSYFIRTLLRLQKGLQDGRWCVGGVVSFRVDSIENECISKYHQLAKYNWQRD